MPDRLHLLILGVIMLVGFARGLFWVVTTEVFNPVDEAQHFAYVESVAHGDLPVVGEDKLSLDVLGISKSSPTLPFQSHPYIVSRDFDWGAYGESYEGSGVQGPIYYALLIPPYWVGDAIGNVAGVYAVRLGSLIIALTSVPLLWLLARRLFQSEPAIWLAAPAILVLIQGFNANLVSVNNDARLVPVSIAAMIPVASAFDGRLTDRQAMAAGALFGLAMLVKPTAPPLAAYTGLVLLWVLVSRRQRSFVPAPAARSLSATTLCSYVKRLRRILPSFF